MLRCEVEYDRQAYDTILRWTMPRFEDLMDGQGRIRLRTKYVSDSANDALCGGLFKVCRGWLFTADGFSCAGDGPYWLLTLKFERFPAEQNYVKIGDKYAFQRYAEADFDAMLAALEPYELVADEPVVVDTSLAPA